MQQKEDNIINDFLNDGFVILKNCIDNKLIQISQTQINNSLKELLKLQKKSFVDDYNDNFYECIKYYSQHHVQQYLARDLVKNNIVKNILLANSLNSTLKLIIGMDIEYFRSFELAINVKNVKDEYLVKKFHQEFWSGVGVNSINIWIPLSLKPGMGTLEIVRGSHKWGHIPHKNREPIGIPDNSEIINCDDVSENDVIIFTSFTLHRTKINENNLPRFAMPVVARNFYYPKTGNEDLMNFEILNLSPISKFRKLLGNSQYSPFRTLGSNRKII